MQLMRIAVLVSLLASLLGACASGGTTSSHSQYPEQYDTTVLADTAHQDKLRAIGADVRVKLAKACTQSDPTLPSWSESHSLLSLAACYDSKIKEAFNEPLGEASCAAEMERDNFFTCLMAGSYLNDILRNMDSPKVLSTEEWQDLSLAVKNVNAEIAAQSMFQCAKSTAADCQLAFLLRAYGLGDEAGDICARQVDAMGCLMRESMTIFIKDRALLIW
ncbi:MAG: hypothetical protein IPK59_05360 [Rhodospirillaceae bacterium]|nr:hypothetical protein [Rhodospirillaceae bacterium]